MDILNKNYVITFPNKDKWSVPVRVIAESRAKFYAHEFDGDITKSAIEDTVPLFTEDHSEIEDWAKNNMSWSEVVANATLLEFGITDYEDGWMNGDSEIL